MQSPFPDQAHFLAFRAFSAMRSEAQTLKGCDRKRATQADLFAMAKQYRSPLLRRLRNLQTEVATGRTRRSYGRGAFSEEGGNREAGTVDWAAGEKSVCSAYACPALQPSYTPAWRLPQRHRHRWSGSAAGQKKWPRKKRMASWKDNDNRLRRPRRRRPGSHGGRNARKHKWHLCFQSASKLLPAWSSAADCAARRHTIREINESASVSQLL